MDVTFLLVAQEDFVGNESFDFEEEYIFGVYESETGIRMDWNPECVWPAYPVGTPIQDRIGMAQFPATYISLAQLAENGTITLPILQANYFVVGELTVTLEDGHVTFSHTIDEDKAAEGEVFFLVSAQAPGADALKGSTMDAAQGYTPAEGDAGFWLVYQVQVTVTDEMLQLGEGIETVDIDSDPMVQAGTDVLHAE